MGVLCCTSNDRNMQKSGLARSGNGDFNPNLYFSEQLSFNSAKVAMSKTAKKLI